MKIKICDSVEIIVFTGPESSGKTTCAERIARTNQLPLVEEYARDYLTIHGPDYTLDDIRKIATTQIENERETESTNSLIVCDTDIVTLEIWAQEKYNTSLNIHDHLSNKKHYYLCFPDIPWEADPLRENPNDRMRLFNIYKDYLENKNLSFTIVNEVQRTTLTL